MSSTLKTAKQLYQLRRQRERALGYDLFADPAWDMLLDLFIAHGEGRVVYSSALCAASAAPATTALRHMKYLEAAGHIHRLPHPNDNRLVIIELISETRHTIAKILSGAHGLDAPEAPRAGVAALLAAEAMQEGDTVWVKVNLLAARSLR